MGCLSSKDGGRGSNEMHRSSNKAGVNDTRESRNMELISADAAFASLRARCRLNRLVSAINSQCGQRLFPPATPQLRTRCLCRPTRRLTSLSPGIVLAQHRIFVELFVETFALFIFFFSGTTFTAGPSQNALFQIFNSSTRFFKII
jgi:hypothetical protein